LIPVTVSEGYLVLGGRCCVTVTGEVVGTILAVALASHLFAYSGTGVATRKFETSVDSLLRILVLVGVIDTSPEFNSERA